MFRCGLNRQQVALSRWQLELAALVQRNCTPLERTRKAQNMQRYAHAHAQHHRGAEVVGVSQTHRRTTHWSASVSVTEMRSGWSGPTEFCLSDFWLICKDQRMTNYWFFVVFASRHQPNHQRTLKKNPLLSRLKHRRAVWLSWVSFLWFSGGFTKSHLWLFGGNSFKATGSLVWRVTL